MSVAVCILAYAPVEGYSLRQLRRRTWFIFLSTLHLAHFRNTTHCILTLVLVSVSDYASLRCTTKAVTTRQHRCVLPSHTSLLTCSQIATTGFGYQHAYRLRQQAVFPFDVRLACVRGRSDKRGRSRPLRWLAQRCVRHSKAIPFPSENARLSHRCSIDSYRWSASPLPCARLSFFARAFRLAYMKRPTPCRGGA